MRCPTCRMSVNIDASDEVKDYIHNLHAQVQFLLKELGHDPNKCYTLPDGTCIAANCPCLGDKQL